MTRTIRHLITAALALSLPFGSTLTYSAPEPTVAPLPVTFRIPGGVLDVEEDGSARYVPGAYALRALDVTGGILFVMSDDTYRTCRDYVTSDVECNVSSWLYMDV